jgi:hypothetical protein
MITCLEASNSSCRVPPSGPAVCIVYRQTLRFVLDWIVITKRCRPGRKNRTVRGQSPINAKMLTFCAEHTLVTSKSLAYYLQRWKPRWPEQHQVFKPSIPITQSRPRGFRSRLDRLVQTVTCSQPGTPALHIKFKTFQLDAEPVGAVFDHNLTKIGLARLGADARKELYHGL